MGLLFGESLLAIHTLSALAGSITLIFVCLITKEFGGKRFAIGLSALGFIIAPIWLTINSFCAYDGFDQCILSILNKKAGSSSEIKPPTAEALLCYYTAEQLRAHFLGLGLGIRSVSFQPKPLNPKAGETDSDPVLKEGNLLSNVFNRAIRSCFYTAQKYYDGRIPVGNISGEILKEAKEAILEYERLMFKCDFHLVMNLMDIYIRNINKFWTRSIKAAEESNDDGIRIQVLIDAFHMVRIAAVLMHPIAPLGTEMVRDYLNLGQEFWDWKRIFEPVYAFMNNPNDHKLKFLEPRVDFFEKHPSQIG